MRTSLPRLLADLKRRRVFRAATVYGGAGFVVLQVVDLLAEALTLPPSVMRGTTLLVLAGFPVALVLAWALQAGPDGVKRATSATPEELEAILAQPPSQRWPSGILALVGVFALAWAAWWVGRSTAPSETIREASSDPARDEILRVAYSDLADDPRPTVAVLPFLDLSETQDQRYFTDGMTEEILNALAKVRELRVSGRTSSFAYRDQERDLRQIGEALGVRFIIEGSLRQQGTLRRITAQLVDAAGDFHLWSQTWDYEVDDIFRIQTEIAEAVAAELQVSLGLAEGEALVRPAGDMEAYDRYLLARARMRDRGPGVAEARDLFAQVTELDASFAPGWAGLAMSESLLPFYYPPEGNTSYDPPVWAAALERAEAAALRALELDSRNATAEVALGSLYRDRFEWERSELHFLRALEVDPDNPEAHQQYGEMLLTTGRWPEALRSVRRAVALDPTAIIRVNVLCHTLYVIRRFDEARQVCEEAVRERPDYPSPYANLALVHLALDDVERAVDVLGELPQLAIHAGPLRTAWIARDLDALQVALAGIGQDGATLFVELGDTARAIAALERRATFPFMAGGWGRVWMKDPAEIRSDPRFADMLRRIRLER